MEYQGLYERINIKICLKDRMEARGLDSSGLGCVSVAGVGKYGNERFRLFLDYLKN
jgi:hypothetical protein